MEKSIYRFLSHSKNDFGYVNYLSSHLAGVAKRASEYASYFGAADEAFFVGSFHDLGKYGRLFQRRLEGKEPGIDHWSAGASVALERCQANGIASALAIQGHHIGLQMCEKDSLRELMRYVQEGKPRDGRRLSESPVSVLLDRMTSDGITCTDFKGPSVFDYALSEKASASAMLDVRMLYSTLVDADFIETEAHFNGRPDGTPGYRKNGPSLESERALTELDTYLNDLAANSCASLDVQRLRADLLSACRNAASQHPGQFTLTAPTGTGKTLSMLSFALEHAKQHELRRIVVVIPYLSIIEQTVSVFRQVLERAFGADYILEQHSLAGTGEQKSTVGDDRKHTRDLLAQNWDAPILVTTSVQLLESLFSNRPSACRKLHRLSKSVILFDEVQTLPTNIIVPTLATLSRLTERYGSTVVFSTATQPAFECLKTKISNYCHAGWNPHEIVPANLRMFQRAKRTKVSWPSSDNRISWIDLSARLSECEQVLCIVNLKKHARDLFELVQEEQPANTYHLSTSMCPAHRKHILNDVRQQLDNRKPCRLISTQCVEAGVDVDFPVVYRAMGPMDAIAQAAGRCNRNGRSESGDVIIFVPEVDGSLCPPGAYQQATGATEAIIKTYESRQPSIDDPKLFEKYYRKLYDLNRPGDQNTELTKAILRLDFIDVAKQYRLIDGPAINVLVPYDLDKLDRLCDELRESEKGMTRAWQAKARPYTVALYRPGAHEPFMEPVEERYGSKEISDWYIYLKDHAADYTRDLGLIPPNDNLLIA